VPVLPVYRCRSPVTVSTNGDTGTDDAEDTASRNARRPYGSTPFTQATHDASRETYPRQETPSSQVATLPLNTPGIGGSGRFLNRIMGKLSPRKQRTPMPRPRNMFGARGAIRNPSRTMQSLRSFARY
jgi:hypothetical protein